MVHIFITLFMMLVAVISVLFIVGISGSTVVLLMTFWEDVHTMFAKA